MGGGRRESRDAERSIPTLDGWRAIAILLVIASHGIPRSCPLWPLRAFGVQGVFVFFGISGFLITSKLLGEEARGRVDLRAFYVRRAFRILPPALTFLGVVGTLGAMGVLARMPFREWFADAFFLQSYVGEFPGRTQWTGHFWSLSVEEHFYLIFPLCLALLGSRRLRPALPFACLAIASWRFLDDRFGFHQRVFHSVLPLCTDRVADFLLWGCALAIFLRSASARAMLRRLLPTPVWLGLAAAFALLTWSHTELELPLQAMLVPLLLAGTVLGSARLPSRLLELEPARFVGRISYSLYLWQQPFFVAARRVPRWPQSFPLNAILTLACALASHYLVERPFIAFGKRFVASLRSSQALQPPTQSLLTVRTRPRER